MANAVSSTLFKDISIDQNDYNTGQGLVYMGIVLLECVTRYPIHDLEAAAYTRIPSQIVLQKLGPQKWLTFQVSVAFHSTGIVDAEDPLFRARQHFANVHEQLWLIHRDPYLARYHRMWLCVHTTYLTSCIG